MAIEPPAELIQLQRAADRAREEALAQPYSREAWRPWLDAAEAVQAGVTEHAAAAGDVNRYELEKAVKNAAKTV